MASNGFILTLLLGCLTCCCWAAETVPQDIHQQEHQQQQPLTPKLLARIYAIAAGEIAKDPSGSARRFRAVVEKSFNSGQGVGTFNELSPECGTVFTSLLSTVLALVGGVDLPEYMEFLKWLDSVAKPEAGILLGNVKWIGSREECEGLRLPVYHDANNASSVMFTTGGRYCTFRANATRSGNRTTAEAFSGGDLGTQLQTNLELALCLPNPCKGRDAEIAVNYVIQFILGFLIPILQGIPGIGGIIGSLRSFSVLVSGCSETSQEAQSSIGAGAIVMITLTILLVVISLTATLVTRILECKRSKSEKKEASSNDLKETAQPQGTRPQGVFPAIVQAFCLRTNLNKLFAPPASGDTLACLNGIRVLSIFWVVLGHSLFLIVGLLEGKSRATAFSKSRGSVSQKDNPLQLLNDFRKRWQSVIIINATTSVDSFFLLSGALVAYGFFRKIQPEQPKESRKLLRSPKFWLLYYFHRYWRLTPPLMFFLFWQLYLLKYFGNGVFMPKNRAEIEAAGCKKNWWTLALYVQNFVGVSDGCMGHTWYLANDMQMYLISPLMLLPFYFGGITIGSIVSLIVVIISMVCTGVINAHYGFKRGHLNFVPGEIDGYDPTTSYFEIVYIKPYCRVGAYALGIILGYILATKKTIKLPLLVVIGGWLVAFAGGLTLLFLVQPQIAGTGASLTVPQVSTYWSFLRPGFALCVGWVAFACAYGYGGPINALLSFSWFTPLARLTYCTYIVHLSLIYMFYVTYDTKFHLSDSMLIMVFLFNLVASFLASLVLSMLIEAPMLGLEKALLPNSELGKPSNSSAIDPVRSTEKLDDADDVSGSQSTASQDIQMSKM